MHHERRLLLVGLLGDGRTLSGRQFQYSLSRHGRTMRRRRRPLLRRLQRHPPGVPFWPWPLPARGFPMHARYRLLPWHLLRRAEWPDRLHGAVPCRRRKLQPVGRLLQWTLQRAARYMCFSRPGVQPHRRRVHQRHRMLLRPMPRRLLRKQLPGKSVGPSECRVDLCPGARGLARRQWVVVATRDIRGEIRVLMRPFDSRGEGR
jgi:hypothetical protein